MAQTALHCRAAGRARYAVAAAVAMALGIVGLAGTAVGQTPPAKKAPDKGAPAPATPPPGAAQSAWVKLCEKATAVKKDKDGKEEKKDVSICLTHHERLDGNSGMVLVSAALRQIEGQDKQHFMVMVPLGMMLQPGMRAAIYPQDMWEKAQKNEQIDESKLKQVKLVYTLCHPAGCTAELEATPEFLADLKTSAGIVVFAVNAGGQPVGFPVPLNGFNQSYTGNPVDNKQYSEARRALMMQIAQRQQELAEEQKKKAEEQKGAAPPAAKAPAPKK